MVCGSKDISDDEAGWKRKLAPELYKVAREKGTEAPYSGKYVHTTDDGVYQCGVCEAALFPSDTKFDAEKGPAGLRGWPSFSRALPGAVRLENDDSHGMHRIEVMCAKCGSHLGHIFKDETFPSGEHFCINSVCLELQKDTKKNSKSK
ncbi:MAG: peptide-methionine (R)-S-oxide reductase MsrB [Candidatus Liptonbacteria bacterium]|nr:peptide-methionine (R)-S-oxide reductase MsrB [Candidatus Liptonbacteria bacterium]